MNKQLDSKQTESKPKLYTVLCPVNLFRYFLRKQYKDIEISNEKCDELNTEFHKYLTDLKLSEKQKENIMPKQSNEIECPHCNEVIDISLFAKGELAQKLETEIEMKLTNQIEQRLNNKNKEALETSKAELRDKLKLEFQNTVEQLNNEVKGNLKMISDLELSKAKLEIVTITIFFFLVFI